jgi:protein-disulfide isomerase
MRKLLQTIPRRGGRPLSGLLLAGAFLAACAAAVPPKTAQEQPSRSSHSSGMAWREAPVAIANPGPPQLRLDRDPHLGSPQAVIGIVEFSDYQCPYCRGFHQELFPQLKQKYIDTGLVQFIHKDLPLTRIHAQAMPAALAAVCAGQQGRFWQMHDALFESALAPALYPQLAQRLGLDAAKFAACLRDPASAQGILRDMDEARRLGINATPSFLIGRIEGERLVVAGVARGAPSLEVFGREIEALRRLEPDPAAPRQ